MSSKSDFKNLEPQHSIRKHEIAFLVREYLKQLGCHATVQTFLQEHPPAAKGRPPQNKQLLTLKQILELYLEMKHREEQRDRLMKELVQTNALLRQVISIYQPQVGQIPAPNHDVAAIAHVPHGPPFHEAYNGAVQAVPRDEAEAVPEEAAVPERSVYEDETGQLYVIENETDPLAEAYEKMITDTSVADRIAQQLNRALSQRQGARRSSSSKVDEEGNLVDDSMYEQVLDSEAMAELMEQMLPHSESGPISWDPSVHAELSQDPLQQMSMMSPATDGGVAESTHSHSRTRHASTHPTTSATQREQMSASAPLIHTASSTISSPIDDFDRNQPSPTRRPRKRFNITSQMGPGPIADQVASSPSSMPEDAGAAYYQAIPLPGSGELTSQPALQESSSTGSRHASTHHAPAPSAHTPSHGHHTSHTTSHHKSKTHHHSKNHAASSSNISPPPRSSSASQHAKSSRGADSSTPNAKRRKS